MNELPVTMNRASARAVAMRVVEGAAIGGAIWAVLSILQILPGRSADAPGLLLSCAIGAALAGLGLRPALIALLAVLVTLTGVVTWTTMSERLARGWMRNDPRNDANVQAVVALSGAVHPDTTMGSNALDNVLFAAELIAAHPGAVLVTTTTEVRYRNPTGLVSSLVDQERIVSMIGASSTWLRTGLATSTHTEAETAWQLLAPRGIRRIAVVAAPMHTRRACAAFEHVGFIVTCAAARRRTAGGWPSSTSAFDRLTRFGDWVYERTAMIEYRSRGWID